jgi:hypothetical protein
MKQSLRVLGASLTLPLTAWLGLGCAQVPPLRAAFQSAPPHLEAQGPGTVFGGVECAVVDALIYAYRQAQKARDGRMRGGTIHAAGGGYSYDEIVVAGRRDPNRISYPLKPQDVARFHVYAPVRNVNGIRISERPTKEDRRSVRFVDPLHRPLYVLHPSLAIRAYHSEDHEIVEVANLRRPAQPQRVAAAVPAPPRPFGPTCRNRYSSDVAQSPFEVPLLTPTRKSSVP